MKLNARLLTTAITSLLTATSLIASNATLAATDDREQCAGVIKAGKNDCATSKNACHSHVTTDSDPEAWIYLPKGTCERLTGARVVMVTDPTPISAKAAKGPRKPHKVRASKGLLQPLSAAQDAGVATRVTRI